jgi:acetyl esterase/lipase
LSRSGMVETPCRPTDAELTKIRPSLIYFHGSYYVLNQPKLNASNSPYFHWMVPSVATSLSFFFPLSPLKAIILGL